MATCVPIKELKNTAQFTRTVLEADGPVFVTKNGKEAFVSLSAERYHALELEASRARLYAFIDAAEADIAAGRTVDARSAIEALRSRDAS